MVSEQSEGFKLSQLQEMALILPERLRTAEQVKRACWKIWKHCRLNDTSLDSERHCELIEDVVKAALAESQLRMEKAVTSEQRMKKELEAIKEQLKEYKRTKTMLEQTFELTGQSLESLQQKMVALNGSIDEAYGEVESMKERMK